MFNSGKVVPYHRITSKKSHRKVFLKLLSFIKSSNAAKVNKTNEEQFQAFKEMCDDSYMLVTIKYKYTNVLALPPNDTLLLTKYHWTQDAVHNITI